MAEGCVSSLFGEPMHSVCLHWGRDSLQPNCSEKQTRSMALRRPDKLAWKNTTKTPAYYSAHQLPTKLSCEENKSIFLKM